MYACRLYWLIACFREVVVLDSSSVVVVLDGLIGLGLLHAMLVLLINDGIACMVILDKIGWTTRSFHCNVPQISLIWSYEVEDAMGCHALFGILSRLESIPHVHHAPLYGAGCIVACGPDMKRRYNFCFQGSLTRRCNDPSLWTEKFTVNQSMLSHKTICLGV
jgi:hypothetical protein